MRNVDFNKPEQKMLDKMTTIDLFLYFEKDDLNVITELLIYLPPPHEYYWSPRYTLYQICASQLTHNINRL